MLLVCAGLVKMVKDETYSHARYSKWFTKEGESALFPLLARLAGLAAKLY